MGLDRSIDITAEERETVLILLARYLPNTTAWVYGSRVKWTARPASDLDVVVFATLEQADRVSDFREAFEESNLPFRVDLFVWDEVPEQFRKQIEAEHVVLVEKKDLGPPGEWREISLSEAVLVNPTVRLDRGTTYPFVDMAAVNADSRSAFPSEQRKFRGGGSRFHSGDTLMARITPCLENGKIARYHAPDSMSDAHGSTEFIVIRGRPNVTDNEFAYYLTRWNEVRGYAIGQMTGTSGRQRVPVSSLDHLVVPIPSLTEQRAIAHILGALDDKIELNQRMNQALEEMARALFKSWFVDFDPVHARATLKHKHHAATPSQGGSGWSVERARAYLERMDLDIAAVFPDSFVNSELGPIPEGWEVVPLAKVIEVNPPRRLRRGNIAPYLDMANMPTKGQTPEAVVDRPFGSGMRFANGDTLLARITPCLENGKTAYVDFLKENQIGWGSTEYIVLCPKSPLPSEFAYCLGRSTNFREFAIQNMTGTSGRQRVPATAISNYRMTVPNGLGVPQIFGELVKPLFLLASQNADESRALATLRDTLLPKLISGEVRIKEITPLGAVS